MGWLFGNSRCSSGSHRSGDRCVKTKSSFKSVTRKPLTCSLDGKSTYCGKPLRPIIPYFGGKTKVADKIISKSGDHKTFVEPFAGGASVY